MPAGDLVVADHQFELRTTLTGFGTPYLIAYESIAGIGNPAPKVNDADLGHDKGAYLGRDYPAVRVITIPYVLRGTAAAVGANFKALCTAWASSETDLPLHGRLPGFGKFTVTGRPRGLLDDLSQANRGVIRALATFVAGDPTVTWL